MARWRTGHFVDPGKAQTDVHKSFIFGFRKDNTEVNGSQNADYNKHQKGEGLQLFLHKQKNTDKKKGKCDIFHYIFLTQLYNKSDTKAI